MGEWDRIELETPVKINLRVFLDNSGSMRSQWDKTIEGVKEYFAGLQESNSVSYTASLYTFSNKFQTVFQDKALKDIDTEVISDLKADGTWTALYDGLGPELKKMKDSDATELVVVFTDGKDNMSQTYTPKKIAELRDTLEKKGNVTFVFLGASPDVWEEGKTVVGNQSGNFRSFDSAETSLQLSDLRDRTNMYSATIAKFAKSGVATRSVSNFYEDPTPVAEVANSCPDEINNLIKKLDKISKSKK
jgi:hypothetical protein